ncbi:MAG: 50S ribosomal protein L4 [Candidatus Sungbacteria bacterium]|uniref:Large ribosomal subunit protein uL4 n=1 Tax=Candidatus Sungiibacteriota bacterium TaxID=2750080 RepID=A0A9D6DQW7_9BACT|nr:50S ribosomal protein L4 [Candidatus Sungbacteria bacterium]
MQTKIYNQAGEETGTVVLPESVFGLAQNSDLVHQIRVSMLANARRPVAHTKDRSDVRGGGKKPWRQKGTGRARHGSRRSPIWKGGGVSHGPRKDKIYTQKINSGMAKKALHTVLSSKFKTGQIKVIKDFSLEKVSTKKFADWVAQVAENNFTSLLVVLGRSEKNIFQSGRNLSKVKIENVSQLNILDVLKFKKIVFTESALAGLAGRAKLNK